MRYITSVPFAFLIFFLYSPNTNALDSDYGLTGDFNEMKNFVLSQCKTEIALASGIDSTKSNPSQSFDAEFLYRTRNRGVLEEKIKKDQLQLERSISGKDIYFGKRNEKCLKIVSDYHQALVSNDYQILVEEHNRKNKYDDVRRASDFKDIEDEALIINKAIEKNASLAISWLKASRTKNDMKVDEGIFELGGTVSVSKENGFWQVDKAPGVRCTPPDQKNLNVTCQSGNVSLRAATGSDGKITSSLGYIYELKYHQENIPETMFQKVTEDLINLFGVNKYSRLPDNAPRTSSQTDSFIQKLPESTARVGACFKKVFLSSAKAPSSCFLDKNNLLFLSTFACYDEFDYVMSASIFNTRSLRNNGYSEVVSGKLLGLSTSRKADGLSSVKIKLFLPLLLDGIRQSSEEFIQKRDLTSYKKPSL